MFISMFTNYVWCHRCLSQCLLIMMSLVVIWQVFFWFSFQLKGSPLWIPQTAAGTTHLHNLANKILREGLALSTRRTYAAGQKRYYSFCTATKCHPLPTKEATLVLFSTHLAANNTLLYNQGVLISNQAAPCVSRIPWTFQSPAHTQVTTGFKGHQETPGSIPPWDSHVYLSLATLWSRSRRSDCNSLIHIPILWCGHLAALPFLGSWEWTNSLSPVK